MMKDLTKCRNAAQLTKALGERTFHHETAVINIGVLYSLLDAALRGDELWSAINRVLKLVAR
jgi:hypothetical protein